MMEKISIGKIGHLEEGDPVGLSQQIADLAHRFPHLDLRGGCCSTLEIHFDEITYSICAVRTGGVG